MAFNFLRFKPGGGADPKLRTNENAGNEHVGYVGIDLGAEGLNDPQIGSVKTRNIGTPNFAHAQVTVGTSATQIVAARATRRSLLIVTHGATDVFIGAAGVTTGSGLLLVGVKGTGLALDVTGAVFGRVATGSQAVSYFESYD